MNIDSDREDSSKGGSKMLAIERFFNGINSSITMSKFQHLIKYDSINDSAVSALDAATELELNRIEQGSTLMEKKVKSLQQHRFSASKVTKATSSGDASKHYNKWFVVNETKIKWGRSAKPKKHHILVRLVKSIGSSFKEVVIVKGTKWKPKSIFVVADILDIVKESRILTEGILG
eukprot:8969032-Ditylum_brightwellii.AAC.1